MDSKKDYKKLWPGSKPRNYPKLEAIIPIFNPDKILIIRLSSIGDILLTTPVIRLLKRRFPQSQIDYVVKKEFADLLIHHPAIHRLIVFDPGANFQSLKQLKTAIRNYQYDLIIDLHKNFRSFYLTYGSGAQKIVRYRKRILWRFFYVKFKLNVYPEIVPIHLRYLTCLRPYHICDDHQGLNFYFNKESETNILHKYADFLIPTTSPIIGIAPGAKHNTKRWTVEGFSAVINNLNSKRNFKVILFGNHNDRQIVRCLDIKNKHLVLDTTGELSLLETGILMQYCNLVLVNDSGLMHLAVALKKKVVAIFGSTTEELGFFPYTTEHIVVQNRNLTCRPCSHVGRSTCPKRHFKCMKEITAEEVLDAIEKLLNFRPIPVETRTPLT